MCIVPCLIILFSALSGRIDEQQHLAVLAAHQCQAASIHGIRLGLDSLILAKLAGLVGRRPHPLVLAFIDDVDAKGSKTATRDGL